MARRLNGARDGNLQSGEIDAAGPDSAFAVRFCHLCADFRPNRRRSVANGVNRAVSG
jgi:hypothetical protein